MPADPLKETLHRYLRTSREAVLWKLDGLTEREARTPMTPTGTNVLGLVKHLANVEAGYFGDTFGRRFAEVPAWDEVDYDADPHADLYATPEESLSEIRALYVRISTLADETIATLPLDAAGAVPWWPEERRDVTLGQVVVHVLTETARHAGHLDIVRETLDGAVGVRPGGTNLPEDDYDWPAYVERLRGIAEGF